MKSTISSDIKTYEMYVLWICVISDEYNLIIFIMNFDIDVAIIAGFLLVNLCVGAIHGIKVKT